jgi:PAS domain-containing protein
MPKPKVDDSAAVLKAVYRLRAVIEFMMGGDILTANDNFLRVFGYALDELQGRHYNILLTPAARDSCEDRQFWPSSTAASSTSTSASASPRAAARSGFRPPTIPSSTRRASHTRS